MTKSMKKLQDFIAKSAKNGVENNKLIQICSGNDTGHPQKQENDVNGAYKEREQNEQN